MKKTTVKTVKETEVKVIKGKDQIQPRPDTKVAEKLGTNNTKKNNAIDPKANLAVSDKKAKKGSMPPPEKKIEQLPVVKSTRDVRNSAESKEIKEIRETKEPSKSPTKRERAISQNGVDEMKNNFQLDNRKSTSQEKDGQRASSLEKNTLNSGVQRQGSIGKQPEQLNKQNSLKIKEDNIRKQSKPKDSQGNIKESEANPLSVGKIQAANQHQKVSQ